VALDALAAMVCLSHCLHIAIKKIGSGYLKRTKLTEKLNKSEVLVCGSEFLSRILNFFFTKKCLINIAK